MNSTGSIDLENRKPRRAKGTPLFKFRNKVSRVGVVFALISGAIFICTPLFPGFRENLDLEAQVRKDESEEFTDDERYKNNLMLMAYKTVIKEKQKLKEEN